MGKDDCSSLIYFRSNFLQEVDQWKGDNLDPKILTFDKDNFWSDIADPDTGHHSSGTIQTPQYPLAFGGGYESAPGFLR